MDFDVAFLDIGHGDCTVITFTEPDETSPGGERRRCIVIDGGDEGNKGVQGLQPGVPNAGWRLAEYLKAREVRTIDLLIGTHIDADHIGGLLTFLKDHTAKADGQGDRFWNDRVACIGQYWGPLRDAYWGRVGEHEGDAAQEQYHKMMQLLIALKVKRKQTSQNQKEIERLEREIARLRARLDEIIGERNKRALIIQSVRQNYEIGEMIRRHVANPAQDILAPDLSHRPPQLFDSVRIDLLWPDVQIPDTMVRISLFRPVNTMAPPVRPWSAAGPSERTLRPMKLEELLAQVVENQERLASTEDRKANNRSVVISVRPTVWNGPAEKWPVLLLTGDAESESWRRMIPRYAAGELAAYILKVPHHGSAQNGITAEALQAIAPRFAIVSVGQIHALPEATTLNLLRQQAEGPLDVFCIERNHNASPKKCGACQRTPPGCVRRTWEDYRSVVFSFDTEKGKLSIVSAQFVREVPRRHSERSEEPETLHRHSERSEESEALRLAQGDREGERYDLEFHLVRDHETDPNRQLWCRQNEWKN